jgi:predicted dehydrogenase
MSKPRLGVIGAGSWTVASHLPNLARHRDELEFTGICRHGPELLARLRDEYGFAVASEDYRDVIAAGLDIAVVASPTALHHEHAKAALEAGAHVLCEKPMVIDPADAWDLVETARRVDRQLIIAFGSNYTELVTGAKALMDEYGIGELEHVSIQMASVCRELLSATGAYPDAAPDAAPEEATWTDPAISGGGYAQAQLSHALGLGLWLTGARVRSAFALMTAPLDAPVELHDAITLRYDNGAIGVLSGASSHRGGNDDRQQLELRAIGSEGQIHVDLDRDHVSLYRPDGVEITLQVPPGDGLYDCVGPIEALVAAGVGRPVSNESPGDLGARTVEALELAYRSARSGALETRADG